MNSLTLSNSRIQSVFELLGKNENDMTFGLGFSLMKSSSLHYQFLKFFGKEKYAKAPNEIFLQKFDTRDQGYTDIQIEDAEKVFLIIEAKKGWVLPQPSQLQQYEKRLGKKEKEGGVGVISGCSDLYVKKFLNKKFKHSSWNQVWEMTKAAMAISNSPIEKAFLSEFAKYLGKLVKMDREQSNWVYCVSLSYKKINNSTLTFVDVVEKYGTYFFPYNQGGGWPLEPPNYLAFRYYGELQSIHKVEDFQVINSLKDIPDYSINIPKSGQHIFCRLGPPIVPNQIVKKGKIWPSGRIWCMLDTLLTSKTVQDARDLSYKRMKGREWAI